MDIIHEIRVEEVRDIEEGKHFYRVYMEINETIKLPIKNYDQSLMNYTNIIGKKNFQKYKIFDYRINNQLILK